MKRTKGRPQNTTKIDSNHFRNVLKSKNLSIKGLCSEQNEDGSYVICEEKTIRRALQKGVINGKLLEKIALKLDKDPEYISGAFKDDFDKYKKIYGINYKQYEEGISRRKFPIRNQLKESDPRDLIKLFPWFDLNTKSFDSLSKTQQYQLIDDSLYALKKVFSNYFPKNEHGENTLYYPSYSDNYVDELKDYEEDEEFIKYLKKKWQGKQLPEKAIVLTSKKRIGLLTESDILELGRMGIL